MAAEATPGDLKFGVATYSLRQFSRDNCIRMVKALNIEYVDIKEFHLPQNDSPKALAAGRAAFDKAGRRFLTLRHFMLTAHPRTATLHLLEMLIS